MMAQGDLLKDQDSGFNFAHFKADFMSSLVVFLVALPLCIGIAVAVGVSPTRALITGIIGGLIVGFVAGSPLQVSGPAAGLFVIIADLIAQGKEQYLGRMEGATQEEAFEYSLVLLGLAVFFAGILQIIAGQLRLGQWFRAVSPAVIKGMLAGIGVLILTSQVHVMLDHKAMWGEGTDRKPAHGGIQYIATIPEAIIKVFLPPETEEEESDSKDGSDKDNSSKAGANKDASKDEANKEDSKADDAHGHGHGGVDANKNKNHHLAALTGLIAMACFLIWPKIAPAKLKFLPAALIGISLATIFATVTQLEVMKLQVEGNLLNQVTLPSMSWATLATNHIVVTGAIVIALVASAETLLCATAVDQLHQGPRTKYDQELSAQGVGNILCGLVGALPMTGVIVRSSANVASGARTRLSTILHGAWLLIFVAAIPQVLTYIPRSALGALLVYTGIKLVNIKEIKKLSAASRGEVIIYLATVTTIVCTDLLIGVLVGIGLSAAKLLLRFSDLDANLAVSDEGKKARLELIGAATFLCLPKLAKELENVPPGAELTVDFEHLTYIDHACLDLIMNWAQQHANFGGELILDWDVLHGRFSTTAEAKKARAGS